MDKETPRGAMGEAIRMGEACSPQRKMRLYLTSPQNVRTCFCGESMENTCIITMGRTWTGESRTTLSGSVFGAG